MKMKKEKLYQNFGSKLIDALVQVFLFEINALRKKSGIELITEEHLIDSISKKLNHEDLEYIQDYDWMMLINERK